MANGTYYRRGSVLGALLLIAIGGLFLYANLNPDFRVLPLVARYWPVLLIVWGLGKLVDYLILRGRPEAAAATRIGAGTVVALIFVLLIGTAFTAMVNRGMGRGPSLIIGDEDFGCVLGNRYEFTDQLEESLEPGVSIQFRNVRGDIVVSGSEENRILISSRKTVCESSENRARTLADRIEPVLESREDGYDFRWEMPSNTTGLLSTDIQVQLPRQANVKAESRRGDIRLRDLQGKVEIDLSRGEATAENIDGEVLANLRRSSARIVDITGSVSVEGSGDEIHIENTGGPAKLRGQYYGDIALLRIGGRAEFVSRVTNFTADRIDGALTIESGDLVLRNAKGDVTLVTRDKDIEVDGVDGRLRIENRSGRVLVRAEKPPTQPIEVENRTGSIELVLPASSGFEISATARNGSVDSDFVGPTLTLEQEERATQVLKGTYGSGRPTFRLSTRHSDIRLRKQ